MHVPLQQKVSQSYCNMCVALTETKTKGAKVIVTCVPKESKQSYCNACATLTEGKGTKATWCVASYCNAFATLTEAKGNKVIAMCLLL